ncbi:MAG: UDP-N-acetylmuramate dehydrogenase [Patescibacteria group bacterium]|nr:UDP-N-acetylmuramate dehydrogenase [Patescibacteria group bacterium]
MNRYKKLKNILGSELKEHIVLRDYSTMKVGGVADYFYIAGSINKLVSAVLAAKKLNIPYTVLGGMSNVLISDFGFGGLVIVNRSNNIAVLKETAQIIADSGVSLSRLIMEAVNNNLAGLEALYGIYGTVGGAIYGNAGAFNTEISQYIKNITVLTVSGKIIRYPATYLETGYRVTKLKRMKAEGREIPVILSVKFQLSQSKKEDILKKLSFYQKSRAEKQPNSENSLGSIFKNPGLGKEKSAGYILESIGAKKIKIGDAQISKKHANFIINKGMAKAAQIKALIEQVKDKAKKEKEISLQEEIEYLGQWD